MMDEYNDIDDIQGLDDFSDEEFQVETFREDYSGSYLNDEIKKISPVNEDDSKDDSNIDNEHPDHILTEDIDLLNGFSVEEINLDALFNQE
jgi:hypothetical protein